MNVNNSNNNVSMSPESSSSSPLATKTTTTTKITALASSSSSPSPSTQLSLWLLPSAGPFRDRMRNQIQHYAQTVDGASHEFEPHVTIVGGFSCANTNETSVDQIVQVLKQGLSGFGPVRMSLQQDNEDNDDEHHGCRVEGHSELGAWSQALYLPMQASNDFVALCRLTRNLLQMPTTVDNDNVESLFAPPANVPHMSLCYAKYVPPATFVEARDRLRDMMNNNNEQNENNENQGDNNDDDSPFSFVAETCALYQTDPSSVIGVADWREVVTIDLRTTARATTTTITS